MIVYRESELDGNYFIEYLVVYDDGLLKSPKILPSRYESRIHSKLIVEEIKCIKVLSLREKNVQLSTYDSFINSLGHWIVADDCSPRGAFEEVPHLITFMTFKIEEETARQITSADFVLSSKISRPLSLYHGTKQCNVSGILKCGLIPSTGMMGNAVYLGTVWKASRFAALSQTYEKQKGSIFRVLTFPKSCLEFPRPWWRCSCEKCLLNSWASAIVDHCGFWQSNYQCAHVTTTKAEGFLKDGSQKYLIKNDEWAVICNTFPTHYAAINTSSLFEPHYDPKFRDITIS
jgi:hypothetical protein